MNNDAFIVMSEDGETENVTATRLMQSINPTGFIVIGGDSAQNIFNS